MCENEQTPEDQSVQNKKLYVRGRNIQQRNSIFSVSFFCLFSIFCECFRNLREFWGGINVENTPSEIESILQILNCGAIANIFIYFLMLYLFVRTIEHPTGWHRLPIFFCMFSNASEYDRTLFRSLSALFNEI